MARQGNVDLEPIGMKCRRKPGTVGEFDRNVARHSE